MPHSTTPDSDDKRRAANRRNSQRSTGPKTEAGKRASAQNALRHGFFSTRALLTGECLEEFQAFHAALLLQLAPRNPFETHAVEHYIVLAWRLKRLPEIEATVFNRYGISVQGNQCGAGFALVASVQSDNILGQLARYEATLRKYAFKYLDLFRSLRQDGWDPVAPTEIETEMIAALPEASSPATPEEKTVAAATETLPRVEPASAKPEGLGGADHEPAVAPSESDFFNSNPNAKSPPEVTEDKPDEQSNEH